MLVIVLVGIVTLSGCVGIATRAVPAASQPGTTVAPAGPSAQVIMPTSTPPAVNQGTTVQFSADPPGTWSCSGTDSTGAATTCKGSINASTGFYTAPATVTAQHSYGGFQLHPNNHIYNTRIDSLPVHPNSATWLAAVGGGNPNYSYDFPVNYVTPSTPTQNMGFLYTPGNNGTYEVPGFPDAEIESGWFSARAGQGADHHMQMIDTVTGQFEEFYQYYTVGLNGSCPTCGSQSGIKYLNSSYDLPAGGSTDAAGLELMPLELGIQEMEQAAAIGGTINHALRVTFGQGNECSCKLWPATTFANDGGFLPFGARARLKASFDISSYSPIAKILLTQLKQYGIINADGGNNWPISVQHGRWPKAYVSAFQEVARANLASNMEFVDESSLMVSPTSGLTTINREIVTFTRASDSAKASVDVVLQGVAVNLPQDVLYIQAGTPAQQLTAFVNIGGVTWSMSPSVGTLTSTGLYTAPATVASPTTTIVTATSVVNSSVAASMNITIFPTGSIRVMPASNADYVDSSGNTWTSRTGVSNIEDDLGCCNFDPSFPNITDSQLWSYIMYRFNDIHMDFRVPAGTYQITYRVGTNLNAPVVVKLGAQGRILADNVDLLAAAGGDHKPYTFTATVTVGSDNKLSFVIWDTPTGNYGVVSSLQITPQ